jgi:3-oxoadipate enol-lactonase
MTRLRHRLDGPADAPVVVFSNAIGTSLELWQAQAEALADRFRILRYDHRGQGGSDVPPGPYSIPLLADDLASLLDELEIARASFVGLSLGGAVGMQFAVASPERLDRLVLACTSARFGPRESWLERAALVRRGGIGPLVGPVLARWFTAGAPADEVARCRVMLEATPVEGYAACCEALAEWDFRPQLGDIEAPTLVLAGAEDPATPLAHAEEIARGVDAPLRVLEGAAHLANIEQPAAFGSALAELLTSEVAA